MAWPTSHSITVRSSDTLVDLHTNDIADEKQVVHPVCVVPLVGLE